jgi:hypothetical protein
MIRIFLSARPVAALMVQLPDIFAINAIPGELCRSIVAMRAACKTR